MLIIHESKQAMDRILTSVQNHNTDLENFNQPLGIQGHLLWLFFTSMKLK